jgi:RimJ/RimL family protein N-acetyltransferase
MTIPTLQTSRLTLSGHRAEDLEDSLAMWSDPAVTRYVGGKVFGREDVWARLLRYLGHWAISGYGFWQVRERATGRFVGEVGLADFKRDLVPPFDGEPEAGWVLSPWSHGKGYATEAMSAALDWVAAAGYPRTVCMIDPPNLSSLRVAEKLGFRERLRTPYKRAEVVILARDATGTSAG